MLYFNCIEFYSLYSLLFAANKTKRVQHNETEMFGPSVDFDLVRGASFSCVGPCTMSEKSVQIIFNSSFP